MEDQVVGAAVLQQGPIVVPGLVGWEDSERENYLAYYLIRDCQNKNGKVYLVRFE